MKIFLTGHRPGKRLNEPLASIGMLNVMRHLQMDYDDLTIISGAADGADRLWARAAWVCQVPYHIYVPRGYKEHYKLGKWFDDMLSFAKEVHYTQDWLGSDSKFYIKLNHIRNKHMHTDADWAVICSSVDPVELIKEKRGGTRHAAELILTSQMPYWWVNSLTGEVERRIEQESLL